MLTGLVEVRRRRGVVQLLVSLRQVPEPNQNKNISASLAIAGIQLGST